MPWVWKNPSIYDHDPRICSWDRQTTDSRHCTCGALANKWELEETLRKRDASVKS